MDDIGINSVTVYNLEKTLNLGRGDFVSLSNAISQTNLSGASGKIITLFDEVKSSVSMLSDSYAEMSDTVTNVKTKIEELFPENSQLFDILDKSSDDLFDYLLNEVERLCNPNELLVFFDRKEDGYDSERLKPLPVGMSVADYYNDMVLPNGTVVDGNTYANLLQATILREYSGREASAKSMLLPMALAAEKGLQITYEHQGTVGYDKTYSTRKAATIDIMLKGSDCNSLVSYATHQGATVPFSWLGVTEFRDRNYNKYKFDNYSDAQVADVLLNGKHVMMVIENDPETETMIVAESTGPGNMVTKWSYQEINTGRFHGGFGVYDMSRFYE